MNQRRNTTGGVGAASTSSSKVEMINNSVQKQMEPHPESLLIEPIERPALLSTIPPDWLAVEQQPPQFSHTISPDFSDEEIASNNNASSKNS